MVEERRQFNTQVSQLASCILELFKHKLLFEIIKYFFVFLFSLTIHFSWAIFNKRNTNIRA